MAKLYRKLEARAGNITFTRNIQGYVCWYSFLRAILREKMKNSNFEKNKNFFQSRKFRPKMTSRPRPHSKQQVFLLVLVFADGFLWSRDFSIFSQVASLRAKKGKFSDSEWVVSEKGEVAAPIKVVSCRTYFRTFLEWKTPLRFSRNGIFRNFSYSEDIICTKSRSVIRAQSNLVFWAEVSLIVES